MPANYYEDDASVGDFDDEHIMDQEDYDESNGSMNEMLSKLLITCCKT
jgi:hypothetical protein